MHFRTQPSRTAALLLTTALLSPLAAGLAGCSMISPYKNCDGSENRLKELASLKILESRPPRTAVPKNYGGVATGCDDDSSGDAWLSAEWLYSFPGSRAEIIDYYGKAAIADGWEVEEDTSAVAAHPEAEGICFTKGGDGEAMLLTVDFRTEVFGPDPPDFGTGTGYRVSAGAEIDGSESYCWK